jgi:hypothetical protein
VDDLFRNFGQASCLRHDESPQVVSAVTPPSLVFLTGQKRASEAGTVIVDLQSDWRPRAYLCMLHRGVATCNAWPFSERLLRFALPFRDTESDKELNVHHENPRPKASHRHRRLYAARMRYLRHSLLPGVRVRLRH